MVTKLKKKNDTYYCVNCQMHQPHLDNICWWCGGQFSNYEQMLIEEDAEAFIMHMHLNKGADNNESNIYREN